MTSPRVPRSATKRSRVSFEDVYEENIDVDNVADGPVEIHDQDPEGKFVVLFNKGSEDISIGGWQLVREAGDAKTTYKLPRNTVIKPAVSLTIWSAETKHAHNPPNDLLMKQNWAHEDEMVTSLLDNDAKPIAKRQTKKSLRATKRKRPTTSAEDSSKCAIM
jgi:lamin B